MIGSCEATEEQLSERLDGELHGLRRFSVTRHLLACPRCRAVLASLARTVEKLRDLGPGETPPSPALVEAVVRRLHSEQERGRQQ